MGSKWQAATTRRIARKPRLSLISKACWPRLAEIDVGGLHYDRNHSLAAMLAQVWASFLDDTWEWGVTRRIWARSSGY
ncbi:hypothetical protein KXW97_008118 [Aspergillus fumigatus]|nr:hypothetical protein KXW97_008118 [Aspergillus fumigatus]